MIFDTKKDKNIRQHIKNENLPIKLLLLADEAIEATKKYLFEVENLVFEQKILQ